MPAPTPDPNPPVSLSTSQSDVSSGQGSKPRSKVRRSAPTSPPLTLADAIEIWKRRRLGEAIHSIAAAFRVNPGRIAEILKGERFPDAESLSLI